MNVPQVVSPAEWEAAREELLVKEKEAKRARRAGRRAPPVAEGPDVRARRRGARQHWTFLDLTPLGRQELWEDSPEGTPQASRYEWWRRHDQYEEDA